MLKASELRRLRGVGVGRAFGYGPNAWAWEAKISGAKVAEGIALLCKVSKANERLS